MGIRATRRVREQRDARTEKHPAHGDEYSPRRQNLLASFQRRQWLGPSAAGIASQGSLLWLPSQRGMFPLCLQPQNDTVPACSASNFIGVKALPLCEPSQNGCLPLLPQAHHQ